MFVPQLLVTDDDAAFREVVCEGLLRRGFQVIPAGDGAEAIELLHRTDVHLALIDVHMPRIGGLELVRRLNDLPRRPACVLMSAEMDEQTRNTAIGLHAYDVLDKPIPLRRLNQTVCTALTELYGWQPSESLG